MGLLEKSSSRLRSKRITWSIQDNTTNHLALIMPGYLWFISLRQQQQWQEAASKPAETTMEGTQQ